jgi:hypothetical protein
MNDNEIGYHEDPKNSNGIIRARTTKQIRSWQIPRSVKALEKLNNEMGNIPFPGIYILFEHMKVYFTRDKITLSYKNDIIDVSEYRLQK